MADEDKINIIKEKIKKFKDDKVWITKKSRIESEARMKKNDTFSQLAITYYTFLVLAISIYGTFCEDDKIGIISIVISIGLFGLSIFIWGIDYKGKAYRYKESYTQLSNLESKIEHLLEYQEEYSQLAKIFNELRQEYNSMLQLTENHEEIDFKKIKSGKDNSAKWTILFYNFKVTSIQAGILLAPIAAVIIIYSIRRS